MTSIDDKKFLRALGERIRSRRQALGLTQIRLAEKCGIHRTFIGSCERGERNISVLNLRLMARILRVRIADLLE